MNDDSNLVEHLISCLAAHHLKHACQLPYNVNKHTYGCTCPMTCNCSPFHISRHAQSSSEVRWYSRSVRVTWQSIYGFCVHGTRACACCSHGKDTLKFRSEESIQQQIPKTEATMTLPAFMRWGFPLEPRPQSRPAALVLNFGWHTVANSEPWPSHEIASLGETEQLQNTQLIWRQTTQVGFPDYGEEMESSIIQSENENEYLILQNHDETNQRMCSYALALTPCLRYTVNSHLLVPFSKDASSCCQRILQAGAPVLSS